MRHVWCLPMKETARQSFYCLSISVFGEAFSVFICISSMGGDVAFYQEIPKLQKWVMFEVCLKYLTFVFNLIASDAEFKRWRGSHAAPGPDGGAVLQAAAAAVRHPGRGAAVRGAAADDSAAEFTEANDRWACFADILQLHDHLKMHLHAHAVTLCAHGILENELWWFYSHAIFQITRMR